MRYAARAGWLSLLVALLACQSPSSAPPPAAPAATSASSSAPAAAAAGAAPAAAAPQTSALPVVRVPPPPAAPPATLDKVAYGIVSYNPFHWVAMVAQATGRMAAYGIDFDLLITR